MRATPPMLRRVLLAPFFVAPDGCEFVMCLAIPAQVCELIEAEHRLAMVDILGVRRKVSMDLLSDAPPQIGDWVLVHVGFALSKISAAQAEEQLKMLTMLGETETASDELRQAM
jgi:hydrogenase expression/formation protein HypC